MTASKLLCVCLLSLVGVLALMPELAPINVSAAPLVSSPLSPDDPTFLSLDPSTGLVAIGSLTNANEVYEQYLTVTTRTNSPQGYSLYLTMADTNTCLRHEDYVDTSSITNYLNPVLSSACALVPADHKLMAGNPNNSMTTNVWGYSIDAGANYLTPQPVNSDPSNPNVATRIKTTAASTTALGDPTTITFGAKRSDYKITPIANGEYAGILVMTALANKPSAPTITTVAPSTGTTGTSITITGTDFNTAHRVTVGGTDCTSATIDSNTQITCVVPAGTPGAVVDVVVTTWGGAATKTGGFTYNLPLPTAQWVKAADTISDAKTSITGASASSYTVDIDANMIPIVNKDTAGNYPSNWCNYDSQQWCNAVTVKPSALAAYQAAPAGTEIAEADIMGYWVYVPRYAYEVQRWYAFNKPQPVGTFDIRFEKTTDAKKVPAAPSTTYSSDAACYIAPASNVGTSSTGGKDYRTECNIDRTYGAATGTTWATHPAFTFGATELSGIWVGKFEASTPTLYANNSDALNGVTNNGELFVKPNQYGLNYLSIGQMFDASILLVLYHGLNSGTTDTRMFSNSDWGATSYLSNSTYGSGAQEVYINNCYISSPSTNYNGRTGWGAATVSAGSTTTCVPGTTDTGAYQTSQGQKASTTANVYGIYDMSGGNYEYVLGNYNKTSSTSYWPAANFTNYTKYYDAYMTADGFSARPTWSSSSTVQYYNFDVCNFSLCGGQANYETTVYQSVSSITQSWGSDYSYFVYSSVPWFLRGGYSINGSYAGLFFSSYYYGSANVNYGFRPSLSAF